MKEDVVIRVENLSKVYPLRHSIEDEFGNSTQEHWALKDVSFEIKKGESVGIIGPNGSGKSTLLKILAGVTKPTSGSVQIKGRVASILDIGAGFHPELSGRENVFLNGQIHGFSKKEIASKFDKIVAFSGIEKFIDEPVKNYSNGMYLRLAFSIMAHLDFDVYLLDEVLSVGDAEFGLVTKNVFNNLLKTQKTILFVSHNISDLKNLNQYILLGEGNLEEKSDNMGLLSRYIEETVIRGGVNLQTKSITINDFSDYNNRINNIVIKQISFFQENDADGIFLTSLPFFLDIYLEKETLGDTVDVVLNITDELGESILLSSTIFIKELNQNINDKKYIIRCTIPENLFANKIYCIHLSFLKNAEKFISHIDNSELTIDSFNKINNNQLEIILTLDNLIYFKPKMILFDKLSFDKLNMTNTALTPIFDWTISNN